MSFQQLLQNSTTVGFLLPEDNLVMCSCGMWREREAICGFPINSVLILGSKESAKFILFSLGPKKEGNVMRQFGKFFLYSISIFPLELLHWYWQNYAGWIEMIEKAIITEWHPCHSPVLHSGNRNYRCITMSVVNKIFALKLFNQSNKNISSCDSRKTIGQLCNLSRK